MNLVILWLKLITRNLIVLHYRYSEIFKVVPYSKSKAAVQYTRHRRKVTKHTEKNTESIKPHADGFLLACKYSKGK